MTEMPFTYLLLPVLVWPLLLAAAASFRATRPLALKFTPWAALPALAAVAIPNGELQLTGVMLGGALALDAIGRVFLLSMSALWLATGLLARPRLHAGDSGPFAVLLLLAMAGGLGMALVGDALWFFAASTLAGYALYGVLMQAGDGTTRQAGNLLVILLVASDLLVFEVLLMLAHSAAGSDFASFRQALVSAESRTLILGLLVVGFGIKIGLLGVHFWLAPVFTTAAAPLRPALVAYMLGAGLLGGLRLLPIGELNAPVAGEILRWLAWATLVYAWLVGTLQLQRRSTLAYAAMALGGLWLAVLSAFLHQPGLWAGSATSLASMLVQAGLALAVLLLTATAVEGKQSPTTVQFAFGLRWLAALLLATAPVGIAGVLTVQADGLPIHLATAVIAFLAGLSLLRREGGAAAVPADMSARTGTGRSASLDMPMSSVLVPATGLAVAAAFALVYQSTGWSFYDAAVSASIALVSLLLGASSARWLVPHLPSLPPGDAVVFIAYAIAAARDAGRRLSDAGLARWPDVARALTQRIWSGVSRISIVHWESALIRWPAALLLMLLLGLLVAWLASS